MCTQPKPQENVESAVDRYMLECSKHAITAQAARYMASAARKRCVDTALEDIIERIKYFASLGMSWMTTDMSQLEKYKPLLMNPSEERDAIYRELTNRGFRVRYCSVIRDGVQSYLHTIIDWSKA